MKKLLILTLISFLPQLAIAGTWYDDWNNVPIYETQTSVRYWGEAYCPIGNINVPLSSPSFYPSLCVNHSSFITGIPAPLCPAGSCSVTLPYAINVNEQVQIGVEHVAIQPFPTNVDVERLGCYGSGRRFIVNTTNISNATTMKIYSAGYPSFPEFILYSGTPQSSKLLIVYPGSSSTMNIRVKLDNGSSFYTTLQNAACTGGGGGGHPLN